MVMGEKNVPIGDAVGFGWEAMKNNVGFFVLVVIIIWLAGGIPSGLQSLTRYMPTAAALVYGLIFAVISFVIGTFIMIAQVTIGLRFVSGETADFDDLLKNYPKFVDMLLGSILYFLIVFGGLLLLIVPGIYWAIRYHFYGYLIVDRNMSPVEAIKKSGELTRGVWWELFVFWLAIIGIQILGFLACCVGLLFAIPVVMVATAYVYRTLLAATPGALEQPVPLAPPVPGPEEQPAE